MSCFINYSLFYRILFNIKQFFFLYFCKFSFTVHLQGTPAILTVPVLNPCLRAEQIHITIDTHTGMLKCHVPKHLDCPVIPDLETALNYDTNKLQNLVSELRFWIIQRRCVKTLQHLPATLHEKLSFLHPFDNLLSQIGRHRVYIKLHRHSNVILVVEIKEKATNSCEMDYKFYLIYVNYVSVEDESVVDRPIIKQEKMDNKTDKNDGKVDSRFEKIERPDNKTPKMYLKIETLVEFDTFTATHGPGTFIYGE